MDAQKLMAALMDRQLELQYNVFRHPPADYGEFLVRLGAWQENQTQQESLRALARDMDEDKE